MRKLILGSFGLVVAVGFVLGCGSGEDKATSSSLTKAQFIKQADEACAKVVKERKAAVESWQKEHPGQLDADGLSDAFREVIVPSIQEQVEAFQSLAAPEADRAEVARMVDNLTEANRGFEKEGAEGMRQPEVSRFEDEARKYGLKICPRLY
jgi:hypothetical protein